VLGTLVLLAAVAISLGMRALADDPPLVLPDVENPGPETVSRNTANPPQADLHDDLACELSQVGWVVAKGTLTNRSSTTSTYMLVVSFNDADGVRFAEAPALHNDVRAGESVRWDAIAPTPPPPGTWTCDIVSIERFASQ
jgi:hypothetical protein